MPLNMNTLGMGNSSGNSGGEDGIFTLREDMEGFISADKYTITSANIKNSITTNIENFSYKYFPLFIFNNEYYYVDGFNQYLYKITVDISESSCYLYKTQINGIYGVFYFVYQGYIYYFSRSNNMSVNYYRYDGETSTGLGSLKTPSSGDITYSNGGTKRWIPLDSLGSKWLVNDTNYSSSVYFEVFSVDESGFLTAFNTSTVSYYEVPTGGANWISLLDGRFIAYDGSNMALYQINYNASYDNYVGSFTKIKTIQELTGDIFNFQYLSLPTYTSLILSTYKSQTLYVYFLQILPGGNYNIIFLFNISIGHVTQSESIAFINKNDLFVFMYAFLNNGNDYSGGYLLNIDGESSNGNIIYHGMLYDGDILYSASDIVSLIPLNGDEIKLNSGTKILEIGTELIQSGEYDIKISANNGLEMLPLIIKDKFGSLSNLQIKKSSTNDQITLTANIIRGMLINGVREIETSGINDLTEDYKLGYLNFQIK